MLYSQNAEAVEYSKKEKFGIIHFASIMLLIILIVIAIASPDILQKNIIDISKDFGMNL